MKPPLRIVLPSTIGLISLALMIWDIHNQRIIMSAGMAWDTGAPLWPYQTPDTVLFALNTPAFFVSTASSNVFRFVLIGSLHYITFFPAIVVWWWLVGWYVDKHRVKQAVSKTPIRAVVLCVLAFALIAVGVEECRWAVRWWLTYSRTVYSATDLILLRLIAPSIWCFVLSVVALLAAKRRLPIA